MVYLHAGEFRAGGANDRENNWPYFANGSVVLVTVNARLGFLGLALGEYSTSPANPSRLLYALLI